MNLDEYLKETKTTQVALGSRVGVSQGAISQWRRDGVPLDRVRAVVRATDGLVSAHDLRPDLFPAGFEFPPEPQPNPEEAAA